MRDINVSLRRRMAAVRTGGSVAALVLSLLSFTACDGGNLFSGDGDPIGAPEVEIVSITPADTVDEGGILDFRLRATSGRRVSRFEIKLRQAVTIDTTIAVSSAVTDITVQGTIKLPTPARDSLLIFSVTAIDQANSISDAVADTLFVRDVTRPNVTIVAEPQNPSGGDTLRLQVTGKDNFGVRSIGYVLLDANGDTISFELAQLAGSIADSAMREFRYPISDTVPPTRIQLVGLAVDVNDLIGTTDTGRCIWAMDSRHQCASSRQRSRPVPQSVTACAWKSSCATTAVSRR